MRTPAAMAKAALPLLALALAARGAVAAAPPTPFSAVPQHAFETYVNISNGLGRLDPYRFYYDGAQKRYRVEGRNGGVFLGKWMEQFQHGGHIGYSHYATASSRGFDCENHYLYGPFPSLAIPSHDVVFDGVASGWPEHTYSWHATSKDYRGRTATRTWHVELRPGKTPLLRKFRTETSETSWPEVEWFFDPLEAPLTLLSDPKYFDTQRLCGKD